MSSNQKENKPQELQTNINKSENQSNNSDSIPTSLETNKDTEFSQSQISNADVKNQILPDELVQIQSAQSNTDKNIQVEAKTESIVQVQQKKQVVSNPIMVQPIKKEEASIQVGSSNKLEVLKNTEETYAPQSCEVHEVKYETFKAPKQQLDKANQNQNRKKSQVQIQVGVSLVDQPQKIINQAKQQRILVDQQKFIKFLENVKLVSTNQKQVLNHIYQSIQKRKAQILGWNDILKNNFVQYAVFVKDFYEKAEKVPKLQKAQQLNKYLNIGEELQDGFSHLMKFREDSGQNYRGMLQYIYCKAIVDLQKAYKKYGEQMSAAQSLVKDKKKACLKIQQQFKQQGSKIKKMFNRIKQGSKQQSDFFIQIAKIIGLEQKFRNALMEWGRQIVELRKNLIRSCQFYANDIQTTLNAFKTQSNSLYGIQKVKYDKIRSAQKEIAQECSFSKLILLVDSDYIRYSLESSTKKEVNEINDKVFEMFVGVPQAALLLGQPRQMLNNLIVKQFSLKDTTQKMVSTLSGNLVLYNKQTLQCSQKMSVKHIKDATAINNGVIQVEEKIPGIIFDSKKRVTIDFKDADRAEQLMCYLGQGQTSNN